MTEPVKTDGIYNLTIPVVGSFLQIFEPKAFTENGKAKGDPKFSANLNILADSPDLAAMKTLAAKLARAKWPDKAFFATVQETGEKIPQIIFPFSNGDKLADAAKEKKKDGEYMRGKVVISARSKYEPRLSYIDNGKIVDVENEAQRAIAKTKFFSGVELLAQLNFVPYDAVGQNGKPGVTAYLNMLLSTGKGTRIGGGQTASEAFKGYVGTVSTDNPLGAPGADQMLDDII